MTLPIRSMYATDSQAMLSKAQALDAALITTEKDLVRLRRPEAGSQLAALARASDCLRVKLELADAEDLRSDILSKLDQLPH